MDPKKNQSNNVASSKSVPKTLLPLLPGLGRPLNYLPSKTDPDYAGECFGSALMTRSNGCLLPMTTIREFVMLQCMNVITDKPDWYIKVNNPEITAKWKEEALASKNLDLTEKMVDYCLDELRYKASLIPAQYANNLPPVIVYNGDVVKSDTALSQEFKEELQQAVKAFEASIPEGRRDWHPGSDEKVWDLVHPSLFPLIYGRTRVLAGGELTTLEDCIDRSGQGETAPVPGKREARDPKGSRDEKPPYSRKYQWLPCEVDISGDEARVTSYINNLHPQKEKPLYRLLEKLIDASIPLWDLTLAPLRSRKFKHKLRIKYKRVRYTNEEDEEKDDSEAASKSNDGDAKMSEIEDETKSEDISMSEAKDDDQEEDSHEDEAKEAKEVQDNDGIDSESHGEENQSEPLEIVEEGTGSDEDQWEDVDSDDDQGGDGDEDEDEDEDGSDNGSDDSEQSKKDPAMLIRPEPKLPFTPLPSPPKFSLREEYRKRGLQIIVKLANIELTPEKPRYDGGSWHIEGQLNEHIVATSLYYYSSSNITTSTLSFRQWFDEMDALNTRYEQDDHVWLQALYGCEQEGPAVQDVGSVATREGRLLTFPNILQHCVNPFELADPTRPGHRKIVALFLVDPNIKVVSTANVPCQQQEWWWERVGEASDVRGPKAGAGIAELPRELQDIVLDDVDFPISLREAKILRNELMKERKRFTVWHSQDLAEMFTISLCEH